MSTDADLLVKMEELFHGESPLMTLRVVRSYANLIEQRIEREVAPLDLFTLPNDLPLWKDLYADLVARALRETGSVTKAAEKIGVSKSTLYNQIHKGLLDEIAALDPSFARTLGDLRSAAPGDRREA